MSSKVSEIERYELQTGSCPPVEEISFVQEETNTGASSTMLLPAPFRSKDNIVPGMELVSHLHLVLKKFYCL